MNIPPALWMGVIALVLLVVGARTSRSERSYLPTWLCVLLVAAALYGMWLLLVAQFGHQVMQLG